MKKKKPKYTIYDACISCAKCYENCPEKAISFNDNSFKYEINDSKCISCGLCYRGCVYNSIIKKNKDN